MSKDSDTPRHSPELLAARERFAEATKRLQIYTLVFDYRSAVQGAAAQAEKGSSVWKEMTLERRAARITSLANKIRALGAELPDVLDDHPDGVTEELEEIVTLHLEYLEARHAYIREGGFIDDADLDPVPKLDR